MLFRRLALAIGVLCGLIGSQIPEFAQQYRQRLGGALDELNRMIVQFDIDAQSEQVSREQALERLKENPDALAQRRGKATEDEIARAQRLEGQRQAFRDSGPLARLFGLVRNFDPETVGQAVSDYEPAVPLTYEALVVGGIALLFGWLGTHLIAWPIRRRGKLRRARQASAPG